MIGRRIGLRLWDKVRPTFALQIGRRRIVVRPVAFATAEVATWRPNWKTQLMQRLLEQRAGVFLDVGANVGQSLMDYLSCAAGNGYIGFEPNSLCVSQLEALIVDNSAEDCRAIPVGLWSHDGLNEFFVTQGQPSDTLGTFVASVRPRQPVISLTLPVFKLDTLAQQLLASTSVSLMKIDVEGGELEVLAGARENLRKHRPFIMCEILHRDVHASEQDHQARLQRLHDLLSESDYLIFRVCKDPTEASFQGLRALQRIDSEIYTPQNASQCDYLLLPSERAAEVADVAP